MFLQSHGSRLKHKVRKTFFKLSLGIAYTLAAMYIGDKLDVKRRFVNPVIYYRLQAEKGFPEDPDNWVLETIVNEKHHRELYLKNEKTGLKVRVNDNGTAGSLRDIVKANIDDYTMHVEKKFGGFKQDVKESIDDKLKDLKPDAHEKLSLGLHYFKLKSQRLMQSIKNKAIRNYNKFIDKLKIHKE
ncbi:hypothetical protein J7L02_03960 [Candidatus Woesearchaeota archaeon]|nr:hypothetical protein [Candidatus Woesearchaeota archaeon]